MTSTSAELNQTRIAQARQLLDSIQTAGVAVREDRRRMARLDHYSARLYIYSGQPAKAVPMFRQALPVAQEFHDQELILVPSLFLGLSLTVQGKVNEAIALLDPVLGSMEERFGPDIDTLRAYMYMAILMGMTGNYTRAQSLMKHVQPWAKESRHAAYAGMFHVLSGVAMFGAGDWPEAIQASARALTLGEEANEPLVQYASLDTNSGAQSQLGAHESAMESRRRAVEIRRLHGGGMLKDWFDAIESATYLRAGKPEQAVELARAAADVSRKAGNMMSLVEAGRVLGVGLAQIGGDPEVIDAHLRESLAIADSVGLCMDAIRTLIAHAQVLRARGAIGKADELFRQAKQRLTDEMAPYARAEILRSIELGQSP